MITTNDVLDCHDMTEQDITACFRAFLRPPVHECYYCDSTQAKYRVSQKKTAEGGPWEYYVCHKHLDRFPPGTFNEMEVL